MSTVSGITENYCSTQTSVFEYLFYIFFTFDVCDVIIQFISYGYVQLLFKTVLSQISKRNDQNKVKL
jgi:hypothetical protein